MPVGARGNDDNARVLTDNKPAAASAGEHSSRRDLRPKVVLFEKLYTSLATAAVASPTLSIAAAEMECRRTFPASCLLGDSIPFETRAR